MKNFYIETNISKDDEYIVTKRVTDYLKSKGCKVLDEPSDELECVITIGGDGTIIRTSRDMAHHDVLFVGINLGTLGYLTEIEKDSIESCLNKIIDGNYFIEDRMMIYGQVAGKSLRNPHALNDIVISRTGGLNVVDVRVFVNDSFLTDYRADGVIISTPTGSTGYNLSAGGPIVEPGSRVMVLTPICAHGLNGRSVVLSPDDTIRVEVTGGNGANLSFDGETMVHLDCGESVRVTTSKETTKFLRLSRESFVTTLSRKLG